jgi:hypothetical protein
VVFNPDRCWVVSTKFQYWAHEFDFFVISNNKDMLDQSFPGIVHKIMINVSKIKQEEKDYYSNVEGT